MSYILKHTAEELDHKLELIDENKNLLPYPYVTRFSASSGLEDVGDGSILTSATTQDASNSFLLTECLLPAGTYIISLDIIMALTGASVTTNQGFALKIIIDSIETSVTDLHKIELPAATNVLVYLEAPPTFASGLLIRPQIEEGAEKTTWTPYMHTIGSYVDERFNSTNTKIKVLAESLEELADNNVSGSGMPTVDQDGNALDSSEDYIARFTNGKWVAVKLSVYNGEVV